MSILTAYINDKLRSRLLCPLVPFNLFHYDPFFHLNKFQGSSAFKYYI